MEQGQTTTIRPPQEVSLRTLATDIASLQRGSGAPLPEKRMTSSITAPSKASAGDGRHHTAHTRLWLAILFAIALIGFSYFVVYPALVAPAIIGE